MLADIALAVLAMILAIIGVKIDEPKEKKYARAVIGVAALVAIAACLKAVSDNRDKDFMLAALVANLTPPASTYGAFDDEISKAAEKAGFEKKVDCYHVEAGFACGLTHANAAKPSLLVLDRLQVALMYKALLQNDDSSDLLGTALRHLYKADELGKDEFRNKVGLAGLFVFYKRFNKFPEYNWNDEHGVTISGDTGTARVEVAVSPAELRLATAPDTDLFADIALLIDKKLELRQRVPVPMPPASSPSSPA